MKPYVTVGVRNRTMFESFGVLSSYIKPIPGSSCMIRKAFEVSDGFATRTCYEVEDRQRLRRLFEYEIRQGKYTQAFFDAIDAADKKALADIKAFAAKDPAQMSADELFEDYKTTFNIIVATLHPMVLAIYASDLQDWFDKELKVAVEDENPSQMQLIEYTAMLLTPTRLTTVQKEEQMLHDLQDDFETRYPGGDRTTFDNFCAEEKVAARFQEIATLYGWFHMEYIGEARTAFEYQEQIWERVEELRRAEVAWTSQKSPQERLAETVAAQKTFFASHPDTDLFQQLVFAMQEFLIILDFTKADLVEGLFYARPLLAEIGKRVGPLSWIDVRYLTLKEVERLLKDGEHTNVEYIADRKKNFAYLLENGALTGPFVGAEARRMADELLQSDIVEDVRELKGLITYPGVVRGIARVVTSAADRDDFPQGAILVTHDTTTELTAIIKKSSAIVADQGSMLSHTAIVSREFKIPCLVQTKIGTKVIKSGDEIEVDAEKGIVRLINSSV